MEQFNLLFANAERGLTQQSFDNKFGLKKHFRRRSW